jgi:hypothetical protein
VKKSRRAGKRELVGEKVWWLQSRFDLSDELKDSMERMLH